MSLLDRFRRADGPAKDPPAVDARSRSEIVRSVQEACAAGRFAQALRVADAETERAPRDPEWHRWRASVLADWGRLREARQACETAAALGDDGIALAFLAGSIALREGDARRAEDRMRAVLAREPDHPPALLTLAIALYAQRRLAEAAAAFAKALAVNPGTFEAAHMLANVEFERGDLPTAEAMLRRAIAIDPVQAVAWKDLAAVLTRADRHDEALQAAAEAWTHDREHGDACGAFANYAISLRDAGRLDEALALLAASLPRHPGPDGQYTYGVALLTAGRLREGWDQYEFRWLKEPLRALRCGSRRPAWMGQELRGKTLLLRVEQGIGDTIQMLRYVPWLKALGATLMMRDFDPIVACIDGIDVRIGEHESPDYDYYVNLLSLPRIFGTDLESIPADVPYLTVPDVRRAKWAPRLAADGRLRVGLVWAGSPGHTRDRERSIPLRRLAPLADLAGIRWLSLQKGAGEAALADVPDWQVEPLGAELEDLTDTAAVIDALDLVLAVDTSIAHLAGALGKPVWMLVPTPADWRWLDARDDSPWYPTLRLFRQRVRGDWDEAIARVRSALAEWRPPARQLAACLPTARGAPPATDAWRARVLAPGICTVTETRYGIMQLRTDVAGEGPALQWLGEWQEGQADLVRRSLAAGGTVVFAGAGAGSRIVALAQFVGAQAHVLVVEPDDFARLLLRQNLAANGIGGVTVLRGRLDGDAPDDTVDGLRMQQMSWLVSDAAVAPAPLIAGASESLWRLRPSLSLGVGDAGLVADLADRVRGHGYRTWRCVEPWFRPDNFNGRTDDIFGGRASTFLLAVPEESPFELPAGVGEEL